MIKIIKTILFVAATLCYATGTSSLAQSVKADSQYFLKNISQHSGIWTRMNQQFKMNYPKANPRIQKHIRQMIRSSDYLKDLRINSEPYIYHIVEAVEKRGLPLEIALLPMIESEFNPRTTSSAGAEGLWQIMPRTGRDLGLKQDAWFQGTRDLDASTKGALNHLHYLNGLFKGDRLLSLAAYNCGENRVLNAIKRNKAANKPTHYWDLDLPRETKEYVPKFLALVTIIKEPGKHNISLASIPNRPYFTTVEVQRPLKLSEAANIMGIHEKEVRRLNPGLRKAIMHPKGPHKVAVPSAKAEHFTKTIGKKISTREGIKS